MITSAIIGTAGTIREKASKLTVASSSTYFKGKKMIKKNSLIRIAEEMRKRSLTLSKAWLVTAGTSQTTIMSKVKRRNFLSAR